MNTTPKSRSRYHNFRDPNGNLLTMKQICQQTGLSEKTVRARLREYDTPPTDFKAFLAKQENTESDKGKECDLKTRLQKMKIRELEFKEDLRGGKYVLIADVESEVDILLKALRDRVHAAIMNSRTQREGTERLTEEFEVAKRQILDNLSK